MTTQGPSPLPPTTIQSTTSIPQSTANDFLSAYLDRAATDPALQPNASISEHGPVSRTTASAPNLILHNLKRVQAGLAGEVLGRDLTLAKMNAEDEGAGAAAVSGCSGDDGNAAEEGQGGWDDAEQYEQGQGDELAGQMDVDDAEGGGIDKEERKRKKKERRLAEKKSKGKGAEA